MGGRFWFLWLTAMLVAVAGCEPQDDGPTTNGSRSSAVAQGMDAGTAAGVVVEQLCARIDEGDFAGVQAELARLDTQADRRLSELKEIVDAYQRIEQRREEHRIQAYQKELEELEKLKTEYLAKDETEPNDVGEILAVVIKSHDYAEPEQKEELLARPFVQQMIEKAEQLGQEYENEGKWIDAYAMGYYWLATLFEDNKQYKEKTDKLTEMAAIEVALKDDSCGDTSVERHEGIEPEMFLRAINALDLHYVKVLDYAGMARAALERAHLLGRVLTESQEELAFSIDESKYGKWETGLEAMEKTLAANGTPDKHKLLLLFDEIISLNAVTIDLPEEVMIAQFAEAALATLDPFTAIIWPWQIKDFEKNMTQQFTGIGVEISKATGVLKVASLLPDTPAYNSGLDAEDIILAVDGEPTEDMTIYCAVSKITGPKGTPVTLTVKHAATGETEDITIVRGRIVVPPIRGWQREQDGDWKYMIDPESRIGYLRLTAFTENTVPDAERILRDLEDDGLKGLILDLRFNSGGYLTSAVGIVDMFIRKGVIVSSKPRQGLADVKTAGSWGTHPEYPLVILINEQSASASEIVAGALQDARYERATLVGSRTYGKGSVQIVVPHTGGGSQLKYTMAYYHLPSDQVVKNRYVLEREGRTDWGIAPDVTVELTLDELKEMIDVQRENEVLTRADHDNGAAPLNRHSIEETLEADPQLAVGLLVIKSKMLCETME